MSLLNCYRRLTTRSWLVTNPSQLGRACPKLRCLALRLQHGADAGLLELAVALSRCEGEG
jgi:hypothetical protein